MARQFTEYAYHGKPTIAECRGTPKEQSRVHSWDDLKSELGRVFLEPQFRSFQGLLFTFVEDAFVVGFLVLSRW
jgi:hypothetical protein